MTNPIPEGGHPPVISRMKKKSKWEKLREREEEKMGEEQELEEPKPTGTEKEQEDKDQDKTEAKEDNMATSTGVNRPDIDTSGAVVEDGDESAGKSDSGMIEGGEPDKRAAKVSQDEEEKDGIGSDDQQDSSGEAVKELKKERGINWGDWGDWMDDISTGRN
ncbi:hypothetical protein P154DRAFT_538046 [Amniculicola lignicola CBS 123094]|uniref:Uncharacterized protein n=1 Tax=Amniculicola lignicola CBS 123094 TaxID=1392246 RepID=A0A6A5WB45_9PLEO|nr:hypothetical protein P154DRAFT_538046 [Amniculicola lignicola CBS 123094]